VTSNKEVEIVTPSLPWRIDNENDRREASKFWMERIVTEAAKDPISRLFLALPWSSDDDSAVDAILENLLFAATLEDAGQKQSAGKITDYLGTAIVVHDMRMRAGDMEGGTGCYAVLDVTRSDETAHRVVTTGAAGVLVVLARAYLENRLPLLCIPEEVDTGKKGRNKPIYLRIVKPF